jgi:hypothetical protein
MQLDLIVALAVPSPPADRALSIAQMSNECAEARRRGEARNLDTESERKTWTQK